MELIIYTCIPYMIWLGIDVFRYNKNLKKGRDIYQINQMVNIAVLCGILASFSGNFEVTKNMIITTIGVYGLIYTIYWAICLILKRKYDILFKSTKS